MENTNKDKEKQLNETAVMCSFLNFVAEKHYSLYNIDTRTNTYFWKDEKRIKTSEQLLDMFKEPKNHKHIWYVNTCVICGCTKFV